MLKKTALLAGDGYPYVSKKKSGEGDWCHMAPLLSATLNAISDIKSQSVGRGAIEAKLQATVNCKRWIRCRDQIFRLLTSCFQLLDFPLQTFQQFIWTFLYLDFMLRLLQSVHLRFRCWHWQICVHKICSHLIFCGISLAFGFTFGQYQYGKTLVRNVRLQMEARQIALHQVSWCCETRKASMLFVNDTLLYIYELFKVENKFLNLYTWRRPLGCRQPKFRPVPRSICHCFCCETPFTPQQYLCRKYSEILR